MASRSAPFVQLKSPVSDESHLTNREKIILLRSSKLHGCIFPPWKAPPSAEEFLGSYEDDFEFQLSDEQADVLESWKRPSMIHGQLENFKICKVDLVQDITTDCSVVASLCALTARAEKQGPTHAHVLASVIFPENRTSENGKYIFKLHFNGCFRKVTIDDRLPQSRIARSLHCFDRDDKSNMILALIEKAYLKVRGGYDFPGSNSGTDLWVLTGWIPEQLSLQSEDVVPQAFWKRIFNAFNYGDVLITLGTDKLTNKEENVLGLASEHAYAIIDMQELDDRQLMLIKNPWSKGGTWTGFIDHSNPSTRSQPKFNEALPPGFFWMDLYNVISYFHTVYLNWNPGLFRYRRDCHFPWDPSDRGVPASLTKNPQFSIRAVDGGMVFLVLTRHFQDSDPSQRGVTKHGYINLSAYASSHRLTVRKRSLLQSGYVDAPSVLLKLELLPNTSYVIVVSEQDLANEKMNFSLSAFSLHKLLDFCPAPEEYPYSVQIRGSWNERSAGGNASTSEYRQNPQFALVVPDSSDLSILLETADQDVAVHAKLVWANGQRIPPQIAASDVYGDSGEYTRGTSLAIIAQVLPGTYTIVCSTFEKGQLGEFSLRVSSKSSQCGLKAIAREGAGMLVKTLPLAYFRPGIDRLLAPLTVSRNSRLRFTMRNNSSAARVAHSPIRLALEFAQGPNKRELLTSGDFVFESQLQTPEIDITPAMCSTDGPGVWLVIERAGGSTVSGSEEIQIDVLSYIPGVSVAAWGRESDVPIEELRKQLSRSSVYSRH